MPLALQLTQINANHVMVAINTKFFSKTGAWYLVRQVGSTQQIILVINVVKFVRLVVTSVQTVLVVILVII